jgi:AcrR family transcriptional regulator
VPNRAAARSLAPSQRSSRLSVDAIVGAAIALADEDGLDAVSIRRVAAALGVRPMSLYTHIPSKAALLDLMADDIVGRVADEPPDAGEWRDAVSALARALRQALVDHPWLVAAFRDGREPGAGTTRYARRLAAAVAPLNAPPTVAWTLLGIVNDYTLGHAVRVVTAGHARTLGTAGRDVPDLEALDEVDSVRDSPESFELGLQTVLDGIETRLLRRRS